MNESRTEEKSLAKLEQSDFSEMERRDEAQIASQLKGEVVKDWVYDVRGTPCLSYVGIKEVQRRSGHITLSDPQIMETDTEFRVLVKATDVVNHIEHFGISRASKKMTAYGKEVDDEFALQKAMSKAQRNAIRNVVPERTIAEVVSAWLDQNNGKRRPTQKQPTPVKDASIGKTPGGNPVSDAPISNPSPTKAPAGPPDGVVEGKFTDASKIDTTDSKPFPMSLKQEKALNLLMGKAPRDAVIAVFKEKGVDPMAWRQLAMNDASDIIEELQRIVEAREEERQASNGGTKRQ